MRNDIQLALMAGIDIPIPELQLVCHSPIVKEIAFMGETNFFNAMQYFCINKQTIPQGETVLQTLSNFQILMKVLNESQDKTRKTFFITLLMLLFPKYKVVLMPQSITFVEEGQDPVMIDDDKFDFFQSVMKEVLCVNNLFQEENVVYNPANEAARKIAEKIYQGRRTVAAIKSREGGASSVLTRYLSILTIGANQRLEDCLNYNLFQLFDLMERYTAFVEWDLDLRARLAGGKPDKQVESWMKELHSKK